MEDAQNGKKLNWTNRLYWSSMGALATATLFMGIHVASHTGSQKPSTLETKIWKEEINLEVFKGYEEGFYQMHDDLIIKYTSLWNNKFKNLRGFTPLNPKDVKRMMLVESGGHSGAWIYDPMQFANEGDLGKPSLEERDLEHFLPGYEELKQIKPTQRKNGRLDYRNNGIDSKKSIKYGIRYLFQRAFVFDYDKNEKLSVVNMRPWDEVIERYNGGGDPDYMTKFRAKIPVKK